MTKGSPPADGEALEAHARVLAKERQILDGIVEAMGAVTAAIEELRDIAQGPDARAHAGRLECLSEQLGRQHDQLSEQRRASAARLAKLASAAMAHVRDGLATVPAEKRGGLVEAHEQLRDHRRRLREHARPRVTARGGAVPPRGAPRIASCARERRCGASSSSASADPGGGDGSSRPRLGPAPRPRTMCGEAGR